MINRNNYEEYLLLYIDGELSPLEKQAVDTFLDANPDLKEELELLQQAVLQPEPGLAFSGKNILYRKEEGIHLANYQEYFLLYVDGELGATGKEAVETFVLKNPGLQEEFTLLKQTVLPKEDIVLENKQALYRKEEKRRPIVISLRWASLAAAAIIGVIVMVGNWKNDTDTGTGAGTATAGVSTQPAKDDQGKTGVAPSVQPNRQEPLPLAAKKENTTVPVDPGQQQPSDVPQQSLAVTPQPIAQQQTTSTDPVTPVSIPNTQGNNGSSNTYTGSGEQNRSSVALNATPENVSASYAQPAVATEEEIDPEEDNKNLYVGAVQINPDKVRGFFRKAGRFLSGKVKNKDEEGDGKIQVANLEISKLK